MTNSPNPGNEPEPTSNEPEQASTRRDLRRRQQYRVALVLTLILLAGVGGGSVWLWFFIHRQLGPLVEKTVTKLLNRPIKLGKLESFYINGLRFGASQLPATPTDPDRASVQSVDVAFNPVPLLLQRTLNLDVTLVKPKAYIEQAQDGTWVNTKIQPLPKGAIDIKLKVLRVRNADVVLVPRGAAGNSKQPVALSIPSGKARFLNNNQLIPFDLGGQLVSGGTFQIQGEYRPPMAQAKLALSGSNLGAAEIGRLIQLPIVLNAGKVAGNLEVQIEPEKPLKFLGTAALENVTAKLAQLPQPFAKTSGQLRFKGTQVRLEKVTTLFGQVPAQANGVVDTQSGLNLSARTQQVELKQVLQTFNIKKLPVVASGQLQAALQVTGPLTKPIVSGEFTTTKPAQLDRVNFRTISGGFRVVDTTVTVNNLRATPIVGGLVTGKGQVQLGQKGGVVFDFQALNVPGDAIARNYNLKLPVPIGSVSGRTQIIASLNNPQNYRATGSANLNVAGGSVTASNVQVAGGRFTAQVRAVGVQVSRLAQVPPQLRGLLSGNFNLSGSLASLNPATIQGNGSGSLNVAGGTVTATNVQLNNGRFSAQVRASGVQVERLAQVPPQLKGPLSGAFDVSGSLVSLSPATIRGSGSGSLNVAGGTVTATNVQLNNGRFTAQVRASGVEVSRLAQVPPQLKGPLSGSFTVAGALASLSPATIRGSGSGSLNVAGGTVTATNVQLNNGRFTAQVRASGVEVERLAPVPPQLKGPLSGSFTVAGALASLSPATISGSGSGSLNVAGGTVTATNVQLNNGRFTAQVRASGVEVSRLAPVPPQLKGPLSGNFTVAGALASLSPATISGSGSGSLNVAGGTVTATNVQLNNGRFTAQVRASGVEVSRLAPVPPQIKGPLSGNFTVAGALASLSPATISGSGSGSLNVAGGTVTATNVQLNNGRFTAQVRASGVEVSRLAQVPPQIKGPLSGNFTVAGALASLSPATISGSGSGSLNVAGGTVTATNLQLNNGRFTAQVRASGVEVSRLAQVPPQLQGPLSGNFNLSGSLASLSPAAISGSGSGSLNVAGGTVTATNVQLNNGRFTAQVRASGVEVSRLAPVPPQIKGPLSGNFNLSGSLASLSPSTIRASGSGSLNVAGGTVTATNVQLDNGRFQAVVEPNGVQLAGFSQDLRGRVGGRLNVSGSLTALTPAAIQARGQLNFSEGIALIDRSLTASIVWNGQQLQIQQATANGFNANGVVNVNLANRGLQAIEGFNLNVRATDLNLQQLPAGLPNAVKLAGRADFDGRIAGTPKAPNVNGNLRLRNFVAGGLEFEPLLAGTVNVNPRQGVNLQLSGTEDRINLALAPNYQPISFLVRTKGAVASGTRLGQELLVSVQNFPIDTIKTFAATTPIASQPLSGRLSGDLVVNLNTYGVSGNVAIANPIFGSLKGDSFTGTFQYANGVVALKDGQFKQGDNQYLLSGNITQTPKGPEFQAQLKVAQGELKDVLTALQIFDLSDLSRGFSLPVFGKAADVQVTQVGLPEDPLPTQLRRLSEIEALITQEREQREANSPLPDITEAKGKFTGTVSVVGSSASGITAEFDIEGQNWQWGTYSAKQVIAQGNFKDGILTLLPLRFQSDNSLLSYSGTIGGDAQSGQLQLRKIPIAQLNEVLKLPPAIGFTGSLDATATLSGSLKNPQARGEVSLTDATINQTPVQSALGSFSYNNARLNFGSNVLIAKTDPISIDGSIPFKLPFAAVEPTNNQLSLNIDVHNEGLTLLNLLSGGQVSWVNGSGDVQVKVSGIYDQKAKRPAQLVADGIATVENATIQARVLPDPLTKVTGRVRFDFDRILVEGVQGQYGGGFVTAAGTIPNSQPADQDKPLTVNIGELGINLKGLYRGNVQGNVVITGAALAPKIGGQLNLFNGQVSLEERTPTTVDSTPGTGGEPGSSSPIGFNGLKLTLAQGIQLTRSPIVQFLADGTLTINGSLDNLQPEGKIKLERGQVNLFTTQFRLDRSYENTAEFAPNRGLDPVLDVRLQASVTESTQRRLPTDPLSAEISDAPTPFFGSVQTVRIQAKAAGPVSQLADNLELTSNPPRSKTEIVALLGGSFVDTLGRGDSTLGLINLAGSALLGNVQNVIGDALGLSEFRVFPTIITGGNDQRQQRSSSLGLSAEAGVDISRNFSVSLLKELTTSDPFQYSLSYRLNDKTLLRGFTDFSGNSGAIIEYESRF